MAEKELPKNTIRINKRELLRGPVFWLAVLVSQVVILYALSYYAYHASILPYQFDNMMQSTGIWRIYGTKAYEPENKDALYIIDPRVDSLVNESSSRYSISGYIKDVSVEEGKIQDLVLYVDDEEPFLLAGSYEVRRVLYKECFESEGCGDNVLLDGDITNMRPGQLVEVWVESAGTGEDWYIDTLIILMGYE